MRCGGGAALFNSPIPDYNRRSGLLTRPDALAFPIPPP